MGLILESSRFFKRRWDLSETDFRRIFTFCTVLTFATAVYAFASKEEGNLNELFSGPTAFHNATVTSVRASSAFFRWLPMALFLIAAAQMFSVQERIPRTAISIFARRRAKQEQKTIGDVNISYPYFFICLFSAGIHPHPDAGADWFFFGQCALIAWALWQFRSRRFGIYIWVAAFAVVM